MGRGLKHQGPGGRRREGDSTQSSRVGCQSNQSIFSLGATAAPAGLVNGVNTGELVTELNNQSISTNKT